MSELVVIHCSVIADQRIYSHDTPNGYNFELGRSRLNTKGYRHCYAIDIRKTLGDVR